MRNARWLASAAPLILLSLLPACNSDPTAPTVTETTGTDAATDAPVTPANDAGDDDAGTLPGGNGVKDGTETDVDCGGGAPGVARCPDGKTCLTASDCANAYCNPSNVCATATGNDAHKNGDESDVDCGGTTTGAERCATGKACAIGADCASKICGTDAKCVAATGSDQVQNGDESDVDCGGTTTGAERCVLDQKCNTGTD